MRRIVWVDGSLLPAESAVVRADDSAFAEGRGCYTSARVRGGRVRFAARHVARLKRGAQELRLGELDSATVLRALEELAKAAFPDGEGVVRLQASRDAAGDVHLVGTVRDLGEDHAEWSARIVALPHDGASLSGGQKVTSRLTLALAGEDAQRAGFDEAILVDGSGRLVEGARSNLFVGLADGTLATPPIHSGAVAGIARSVALERVEGIVERPIDREQLATARELVATNSVRGARPITSLDCRPVGDGRPGPWCRALAQALELDEPAMLLRPG